MISVLFWMNKEALRFVASNKCAFLEIEKSFCNSNKCKELAFLIYFFLRGHHSCIFPSLVKSATKICISGTDAKSLWNKQCGQIIQQRKQSVQTFGSTMDRIYGESGKGSPAAARILQLHQQTNKRETLQVLISLLLANKMLFLEETHVYRTEASRAWVGRGLCTGKASAQHKVAVFLLLKSQLPPKQILSRCKIVPSHFLHQLGPVAGI